MIVVSLTGGPKRLLFENLDHDRESFVDLERDIGEPALEQKRIVLRPGERRHVTITKTGRYVNVITTTTVKLVAVEEA